MTYVYSLLQYFVWSRLIKPDRQEKLFQTLALPRVPEVFWVIKRLAKKQSCKTNSPVKPKSLGPEISPVF